MYVIHPSLLPKYRGASPIQYSLLNNDQKAGTSIIEISKGKFDAGSIVYQEAIEVDRHMRYAELAKELATISKQKVLYMHFNPLLGGKRFVDVLLNLDYYLAHKINQTDSEYKASKAPKFEIPDTVLDWNNEPTVKIMSRYRAFWGTNFRTVRTKFNNDWYFINEMSIVEPQSEEAALVEEFTNALPGSLWIVKHRRFKNFIYVKCIDGWVCIKSGNIEHKQTQPTYKFIEQFIRKDKMHDDKLSPGHYFFK